LIIWGRISLYEASGNYSDIRRTLWKGPEALEHCIQALGKKMKVKLKKEKVYLIAPKQLISTFP